MTVWSSGLWIPLTSLASILLHEMPAEVRKPVSACTGGGLAKEIDSVVSSEMLLSNTCTGNGSEWS